MHKTWHWVQARVLGVYLASSAFVKIRLVPQIQKTHRLPELEKKSAGFLNLREITNPEEGEYKYRGGFAGAAEGAFPIALVRSRHGS